MNSMHDMGGMDGMGPVERERDEPVFHHSWEGRTYAMAVSLFPGMMEERFVALVLDGAPIGRAHV